MKKFSLRNKILILLIGILVVSLAINIVWSHQSQMQQAQIDMHEKAQVLAKQLNAVWTFMDLNQEKINTDSDGKESFKGLHCSLVGKSINKLFNAETDYITRYTNVTPRNKADVSDEYEQAALKVFGGDTGVTEYYSIEDYNGEQVFRYVVPMKITQSCLECHGEPAGEIDKLGYPKEGMKVGDLVGVMSIIMPIDLYINSIQGNIAREVFFFFCLMLICIIVIYFTITKLVMRPLAKLDDAVQQVEKGEMTVQLADIGGSVEIMELARNFESMSLQLQTLYDGLEEQVESRTDLLNDANHKLQQANARLQEENQYKSDFLAIVSHELRTPLTAILAFTDIWERDRSFVDRREENIVAEIKNNGNVLLGMINNVLEMARLEVGKTELVIEAVDVADIFAAVHSIVKPLVEKKKIELTVAVAKNVPIIQADWEKLKRIVENLTSNAIKFTNEGGKILLSATYQATSKVLLIRVEDNGIGIAASDLPYIFEKFVQTDTSISRDYNGSGLGLALAKELTELHGGKIEVESTLGGGSTFTVILPVEVVEWGDI